MSWVLIWKSVFVVGVAIFAVMAVWVTIYGARDIKRLLTRIDESHREKSEQDENGDPRKPRGPQMNEDSA